MKRFYLSKLVRHSRGKFPDMCEGVLFARITYLCVWTAHLTEAVLILRWQKKKMTDAFTDQL